MHALVDGTDLRVGVTGAAAQALDSQDASAKAEAIVGIATFVLILVLMGLIFRSVILAVLPLLTIGLVSQVAIGLIGAANKLFDLKTDSSIQVILIVVLFGIGTDYILFFLFRYRERLRAGEDHRSAVAQAVSRAGEAIISAGGAVIVSFMALVLSSLGLFKSIGPALAIAVGVTVVAALTLVPAVVRLIGNRAIFWPSKSWKKEPRSARFTAIGNSLGRHSGRYALASGGALAVLAVFAFGFNPSFDLGNSGSPETVESAVALKTLEKGFPPGTTDPTVVLLHSTDGKPLDQTALTSYGEALGRPTGSARSAAAEHRPADRVVQRLPRQRPHLRHRPGRDQGPGPRGRPFPRASRRRGPGRRHDVGVRRLPEGDDARLLGRLPGRGRADLRDPGAAAAQPGRAVVPHGLGRPRLRGHPRRRRAGLPGSPGPLTA